MPTVCVIGAGAAGIGVARRLGEAGIRYDILEQSDSIGGTWVYDSQVGIGKYNYPVHSSMYANLRTNLPKEVMAFPNFSIHDMKSYVKSEVILKYLNSYANSNNVTKNIYFLHRVLRVKPLLTEGWVVHVKNLKNNEIAVKNYDIVIVCNGHYHTPYIPPIKGLNEYQGKIIHSHDFRKVDPFKDRTVVVVGGGPSGFDIALSVATVAKDVYISHHSKEPFLSSVPKNYHVTSDIQSICGKIVVFTNGTSVVTDDIILCTGFSYSFPFLAEDCGVKVIDNRVSPLYKHMIHIQRPTLCFIGLPFYVCANFMFDLQIRYYIEYLKGNLILPSQDLMHVTLKEDLEMRKVLGFGKRDGHKLGLIQKNYFDDLAREANIPGVPTVMSRLHAESSKRFMEDLQNFRNEDFILLDDTSFIRRPVVP